MLNGDECRTWPPPLMGSSNDVGLEELTPRTIQTNYRPNFQKSETGKTRGGDLGGTEGTVPPKFEVGGRPMHPSSQYFEK